MPLLEKKLIVKPSKIPDSGLGLFTKEFITNKSFIAEYKGRIITWKEGKHDGENQYMYFISYKRVIDAKRTKKAIAKYANDARGIKKVKGITNNCVFINDGKKVYIKSIKNIAAGGEILVKYGKEYWDTIKYNLAIKSDTK